MPATAMFLKHAVAGGGGAAFRTITIAHTMVAGSTKTNFVVWFDFTHNDFKSVANGGLVANANHVRLATDSAGTSISNYDIRVQNLTSGRLAGWVLVPSLSSAIDTVLYIALNDNGITSYQGSRTSVWAGETFGNHGSDGTTVSGADITANGNNLTLHNTPTAVAGQFGGGVHFVASSQQNMSKTIGSGGVLGATTSMTASGWFKPTDLSNYYGVWSSGVVNRDAYLIRTEPSAKMVFFLTQGTNNYKGFSGTTSWTAGVWEHWHATYDGITMRLYKAGVADGTFALTGAGDNDNSAAVAIGSADGSNSWCNGDTEFTRHCSTTARDADWILTEHRNQAAPGTYLTLV